jgi:hypothetical protein
MAKSIPLAKQPAVQGSRAPVRNWAAERIDVPRMIPHLHAICTEMRKS